MINNNFFKNLFYKLSNKLYKKIQIIKSNLKKNISSFKIGQNFQPLYVMKTKFDFMHKILSF